MTSSWEAAFGVQEAGPVSGEASMAAVSDPFDAVPHFDHTRAAAYRGGPAHGDAQLSGYRTRRLIPSHQPSDREVDPGSLLALGALGIWLGVHALRSYLAMSVWNLADELPLQYKSLPPLLVHAIGLLAWPARRAFGGARPLHRFGIAFALATAARQLVGDFDRPAIVAAMLAWIFFLWWLPCYLELLSRLQRRVILPFAAVLGISFQVAGQTLLHGLDVPLLRGPAGWVIATGLAAGFAWLNRRADVPAAGPQMEPMGRSALALLGCWLFLEVTLLANLGRAPMAHQAGLLPTAVLVQSGLVAGVLIAGLEWRMKRLLSGAALLILLPLIAASSEPKLVWLLIARAAAVVTLVGACTRGKSVTHTRAYFGWVFGAGLLFVFLFGFYSSFEAPGLWLWAGMLFVLLGLGSGDDRIVGAPRLAALIAVVALISALGAIIPAPTGKPDATRTAGSLRVMTYNVHQGFDAAALPSMQRIVEEIIAADPDVIALQELHRGWNLLGGAELLAYLSWRLPQYHIVFAPTNGLWGNAIATRLRLQGWSPNSGTAEMRLERRTRTFEYGYIDATFAFASDTVRIFGAHLPADLQGPGDATREQYARQIAEQSPTQRTVVTGDFNAQPETQVLKTLLGDSLVDVAARFGLGAAATWPAHRPVERLDYILATPDLQPVSMRLLRTTASDHLAVVADFVLAPVRRE